MTNNLIINYSVNLFIKFLFNR